MNRPDEAEGILLALLREDERSFQKAYFDLAEIYLQRNEDTRAAEMLRKARPLDPGRADYQLGLIEMRRKQYAGAIPLFRSAAATKPELAPYALTQQGIAEYHLKNFKEAKTTIQKVLTMKLTPEETAQLRQLLQAIEGAARAAKPWYLSASLGVQYDDNVLLNPSGQVRLAPGTRNDKDEDDVGFLTSIYGRYNVVEKDPWKLGVAYNNYSLTYVDHTDLSVLGFRPSIYAQWDKAPVSAYMEYVYSHYLVDNESKVDVHSIFPRVAMMHGKRWRTEAFGGLEWRLYEDQNPDSRHYFLGLTEMFFLMDGRAHVRGGYLFRYEDFVPREVGNVLSNEAMLGFQAPVWKNKWFLDVAGRYIWREFDHDPAISRKKDRCDDEQNLSVVLYGQLTPCLQLSLIYQHTWNDSNIWSYQSFDPYDFQRAVFTCMLTFSY